MADSHTSDNSTQRFAPVAPASERLREVTFPLAVRGYDRRAVEEFVEEVRALVADLEAHQTREGVVQKALDELGEETAGILQRAHETADEIAARSRAQADGRLQRAEREAEIVRREADEYAEQVVVDTRLLWEERQRLIEDLRQLADEVLGTADDALERVKMPEPLVVEEAEATVPEGEVDPEPTQPFQLGAVEEDAGAVDEGAGAVDEGAGAVDEGAGAVEEPLAAEEPPVEPDPDAHSGHTVELEALPGGSEEPPERERD